MKLTELVLIYQITLQRWGRRTADVVALAWCVALLAAAIEVVRGLVQGWVRCPDCGGVTALDTELGLGPAQDEIP